MKSQNRIFTQNKRGGSSFIKKLHAEYFFSRVKVKVNAKASYRKIEEYPLRDFDDALGSEGALNVLS